MTAQSTPRQPVVGVLGPQLVRLVGQLRAAGIPVATSDVIDATEALGQIDILDRGQVRAALGATLVKRSEDVRTFEILFGIHFAPRPSGERGDGRSGSVGREIATSLDRVGTGDGEGDLELLDLIMDAVRRGDPEALRILAGMSIEAFGGLGSQPDASERYFAYRILRSLELSRLMAQMLTAERSRAGVDGIDERAVRAELAERIEAFKRMLAEQIRGQLAELRGAESEGLGLELFGVEEVDFQGASPRQIAAMREAIRPLARALATKMARRRRRRDRGRLDVRRTVRRSLSTGGVPLDPAFKRPKVVRPDLFLLCDVSGSVAEFATFTLTLLQAMTTEFSRMRAFAFVDGIDEVTDHLKDAASFLEARHVLYRADVIRDDGHSDYGAVFERFWGRYGRSIDSRSTVIVTGDARSNHRPPRVETLRQLHTRARKVYLLNPEPEGDWDTTDSIVSAYRPAFDGVFEVRNLRQLADAVYRIT
jgi:uncharacterized protein with von Willebrand factor type A (vWA) domain